MYLYNNSGYGFDFHAGSAGYSQWGSAAAAAAGRTGEQYYRPEQYHQVPIVMCLQLFRF